MVSLDRLNDGEVLQETRGMVVTLIAFIALLPGGKTGQFSGTRGACWKADARSSIVRNAYRLEASNGGIGRSEKIR